MKLLFIFTILLYYSNYGYAKTILKCLAAEESAYHKKNRPKSGPNYKLNQNLISEFIQLNKSIVIDSGQLKYICSKNLGERSKLLLKTLNLNQLKLKTIHDRKSLNLYAIDKVAMDGLKNKSFKLLIKYILDIQSISSDPNCIYKKLPQMKKFMKRVRYIEEDVGIKKLYNEIPNKNSLYSKIFNLDNFNDCSQPQS